MFGIAAQPRSVRLSVYEAVVIGRAGRGAVGTIDTTLARTRARGDIAAEESRNGTGVIVPRSGGRLWCESAVIAATGERGDDGLLRLRLKLGGGNLGSQGRTADGFSSRCAEDGLSGSGGRTPVVGRGGHGSNSRGTIDGAGCWASDDGRRAGVGEA